jgi:parvulin-like peptidyl-prolyl cis-trans isomerase-like protein
MYLRCLVVLLFSSLLMAQPRQEPAPGSSANKDSAAPSQDTSHRTAEQKKAEDQGELKGVADKSKVPLDGPVITIEGLCDQPTGTAAKDASSNCKIVVTREQFERLIDSLGPNLPPARRSQFATAYPRVLLFSKKAKEMGLDKEPRYQEMMSWASLQALTDQLTTQLQEKAGDISDADVEKYYKDNPAKFQQYELLRIFIPKKTQHSMAGTASARAEEEAAMKAEAMKVRAKAAAGGDFAALQKEAFDVAGLKSASANVNLGKKTRGSLSQDHQKVFDLKPGQVSEVFAGPDGFYVYRVVAEQMIPLTEAKTKIHSTLQGERMQASMELLLGPVELELNPAYFGGPTPDRALPSPAPQVSPQGEVKKEPAQEAPAPAPR